MSDEKKQPEEGAASKNIFSDVFKMFLDATPRKNEDGTTIEHCPLDDKIRAALDSANPLEAMERLEAIMDGDELPEAAEKGQGASDPQKLAESFKKVSANPIFDKLPPEARQEIISMANESAAKLEDMMDLMKDFSERPEDEQAAIIGAMEEKARHEILEDVAYVIKVNADTEEGDAFLYRNLQEDPDSAAVVFNMTKGLVTSAARAAAIPILVRRGVDILIAAGISMSEAMLPPKESVRREELTARLASMTKAADPATVAEIIIHAIPKTFYRNLQEDPDSAAVVFNMTKGLVTSAARAAAIPILVRRGVDILIAAGISMSEAMLPPKESVRREELTARLASMTKAADPATVAEIIIHAIPKTFGYFKEHAPERAAALEEAARQEVEKAFAPVFEYVAAINAEPVEEAEEKKLSRAEQEAEYGNTDLIPIDAHREPKDKLTQFLFNGKIKIGDVKKAINVNTDTKPVHTYLSVIPDPDFMEGIRPIYGKGDLRFSREHWRFYRAIMTEILQGNEWTTFSRLYQIEYHQLGRTRPGAISKEKEKEMMDMLYFFQKQFIEADITGEKAYYKKNAELQSMDDVPKGALINFEIWPHYINHNKVDNAIHFLNVPILLKYALAHNHIATIPPKLFQNKAFKRQTEDASDVADMLIHWLMMKNVRNYELAYETVFNYMGVKSSDKTAAAKSRRTRLRNIVFKWMNYWSKDLHLFLWDANNAQYIKIILPKDELEKKKHTLFTAEKIKALM